MVTPNPDLINELLTKALTYLQQNGQELCQKRVNQSGIWCDHVGDLLLVLPLGSRIMALGMDIRKVGNFTALSV